MLENILVPMSRAIGVRDVASHIIERAHLAAEEVRKNLDLSPLTNVAQKAVRNTNFDDRKLSVPELWHIQLNKYSDRLHRREIEELVLLPMLFVNIPGIPEDYLASAARGITRVLFPAGYSEYDIEATMRLNGKLNDFKGTINQLQYVVVQERERPRSVQVNVSIRSHIERYWEPDVEERFPELSSQINKSAKIAKRLQAWRMATAFSGGSVSGK